MAAVQRVLTGTRVDPVAPCVGGTMAIGDTAGRASQIELTRRRIEFCAAPGIESRLMLTGGLGMGETDFCLCRSMPRDGLINNRATWRAIADAGFPGPVEIKLLSKRHRRMKFPRVVSEIVQRISAFVRLDGSH